MIQIFDGNEGHIPTIAQIADKTWHHTYAEILSPDQLNYMLKTIYDSATLTSVMRNGTQQFLLLKDNEGFQGFVSFGARPEDPHIFKIHKLYVLPENQGKGYGTILIHEVKKRMCARGIMKLDLNVNRFNPAQYFYRKLGFRVLREEDIPIGPFWMNDYVMRLEI
jgi:ribosomal protein S18 acetylase RimI-like enzyme